MLQIIYIYIYPYLFGIHHLNLFISVPSATDSPFLPVYNSPSDLAYLAIYTVVFSFICTLKVIRPWAISAKHVASLNGPQPSAQISCCDNGTLASLRTFDLAGEGSQKYDENRQNWYRIYRFLGGTLNFLLLLAYLKDYDELMNYAFHIKCHLFKQCLPQFTEVKGLQLSHRLHIGSVIGSQGVAAHHPQPNLHTNWAGASEMSWKAFHHEFLAQTISLCHHDNITSCIRTYKNGIKPHKTVKPKAQKAKQIHNSNKNLANNDQTS